MDPAFSTRGYQFLMLGGIFNPANQDWPVARKSGTTCILIGQTVSCWLVKVSFGNALRITRVPQTL
jgi:hypothetical protein